MCLHFSPLKAYKGRIYEGPSIFIFGTSGVDLLALRLGRFTSAQRSRYVCRQEKFLSQHALESRSSNL
jgi:hypothetical protein